MIVILLILTILFIYFINKAYQNTKKIEIKTIKVNQTSSTGDSPLLNILHLSDLHLENISISPQQLYERLKDQSIDLIALTGDFLDRKWTIPKLLPYLDVLNELQAPFGMYAVLGNHDYVLRTRNLQKLIDTLEQHNCHVLRNRSTKIYIKGQLVNIIGVDDYSTKRSNLEKSFEDVSQGFNLVLTHDPNIVLHMKNYPFEYLLAGHFHGGQICYPKAYHLVKMGKLARMNVVKGLHKFDGKLFYISEGLGQTGVNIRIGSRPEITIHKVKLRPEQQEMHCVM